jgi:hypothetical protein
VDECLSVATEGGCGGGARPGNAAAGGGGKPKGADVAALVTGKPPKRPEKRLRVIHPWGIFWSDVDFTARPLLGGKRGGGDDDAKEEKEKEEEKEEEEAVAATRARTPGLCP